MKKCPFCGSELPEEASFCPHCAKSLNSRLRPELPRRFPRFVLRLILIFVLLFAAGCAFYFHSRPKTYDSQQSGVLSYTDQDGSYQLLINHSVSDRYQSMGQIDLSAGEEESYRFPLFLYVNDLGSGADASGRFMQKVHSASVEIEQPNGSESPVQASQPEPYSAFPNAALVSLIDFTRQSPSDTQIILKLQMENGDRLFLRTNLHITPVNVYSFSTENADLSDSAALQALIDRIVADPEIHPLDNVNIELPAVRYTEPIVLYDRSFNLTGSEENGKRTDFAAGIQMRSQDEGKWVNYLTNLDFNGDGSGVGLSSAAPRVWVRNCRFRNWKTAFLGFGNSWINAQDCTFEQNNVGLYFNSEGGSPTDTRYTGNHFSGNQTAVLLEQVPSDLKLDFSDSEFSRNETDIDNRCDQPLDLSRAVFR